MKKILFSMIVATFIAFGSVYQAAASPLDDAKAMAEEAAAYMKANGKEKGLAEIQNPQGKFKKGDCSL